MITIELHPDLQEALDRMARQRGQTSADLAQEAVRRLIEDEDDLRVLEARVKESEPRVLWEDVKRKYALDG
jgi:predicted transcriptional regulator